MGITWAQFSIHMYLNFYVYQYSTGISAANALAGGAERRAAGAPRLQELPESGQLDLPARRAEARGRRHDLARAGKAFDVFEGYIDRLEKLAL